MHISKLKNKRKKEGGSIIHILWAIGILAMFIGCGYALYSAIINK